MLNGKSVLFLQSRRHAIAVAVAVAVAVGKPLPPSKETVRASVMIVVIAAVMAILDTLVTRSLSVVSYCCCCAASIMVVAAMAAPTFEVETRTGGRINCLSNNCSLPPATSFEVETPTGGRNNCSSNYCSSTSIPPALPTNVVVGIPFICCCCWGCGIMVKTSKLRRQLHNYSIIFFLFLIASKILKINRAR